MNDKAWIIVLCEADSVHIATDVWGETLFFGSKQNAAGFANSRIKSEYPDQRFVVVEVPHQW